MPGDPHECREHARNCAELAKQATTAQARQTFLSLSETWLRLASELESAQAFLQVMDGMELETPVAAGLSVPADADGGLDKHPKRKTGPAARVL